jgi:chromate transporter
VGILLAALYTPVWTSAITAPVDLAVAASALALLFTGRVPPIVVVGLCALAGQVLGSA